MTTFGKLWAAMLWTAMSKSGDGYHRPSLKHTGRGSDRREDKLEPANSNATFRRYRQRYAKFGNGVGIA